MDPRNPDVPPQQPLPQEPEYTPDYRPEETNSTPAPVPTDEPAAPQQSGRTVAAGTWVALIAGAILLIVLLVFIMQNQDLVSVNLFAWTWSLPAGIAYLFSAIIGALIMALVGGWRMFELRRQLKKARSHV